MCRFFWLTAVIVGQVGCAFLAHPAGEEARERERPKTLLRWASATENENSNGKKDEYGKDDESGSGNGPANGKAPKEEEPDEIVTDRPDFTEASRTVGKGVIQLESGYSFTHDRSGGITNNFHSYPEALFRIGMFADWFELRIGQNFQTLLTGGQSNTGAEDLYLGTKLWLTEQDKFLPETAMMIQTTVPSGADAFTNRKMLPGVALLYSWEVIPNRIRIGAETAGNAAVDTASHSYLQISQTVTVEYELTRKLEAYTEWYGLFPSGAIAGVTPEYYFDGGFTYKVTSNFQLDIFAGVGLNKHAQDGFAGGGFAYRW